DGDYPGAERNGRDPREPGGAAIGRAPRDGNCRNSPGGDQTVRGLAAAFRDPREPVRLEAAGGVRGRKSLTTRGRRFRGPWAGLPCRKTPDGIRACWRRRR